MTDKYVLGHNFRAFIDDVGAGHAESCSYSITTDSQELSDKDVDPGSLEPSAVTLTLGKTRLEIKVTGYVWESDNGSTPASGGYRTHLLNVKNGTLVDFLFGTNASGDTGVVGTGYITNFEATGDDGGQAKYSFTVKSSGTWDVTT